MSPVQLRALKNLYQMAIKFYAKKIEIYNIAEFKHNEASTQRMMLVIRQAMLKNPYFRSLVKNSKAYVLVSN